MIRDQRLEARQSADLPERFTGLKNFLVLGQWEQANQETAAIVLDLAGRSADDWLWLEDFTKIPKSELQLINQLWLTYSRGRFGFSIQQRIWQKAATITEYEAECYVGDRVGWRHASGDWLTYDEITFDLSAPRGHLPLTFAWWIEGAGIVLGGVGKFWQVVKAQPSPSQTPSLLPAETTMSIEVVSPIQPAPLP